MAARVPHRMVLGLVAVAVLLPATLGAGFWSLLGFGFVADALLRSQHPGAAAMVLAALVGGWFGLGTAWRLYYCLLRGDLSFDRRRAWWGLGSGALVAISLIALSSGSLMFRLAFFGWPLLAVAFFGGVLWRLRG
ncbi:hypothetical protein [Comamonas endophytica]|uniref:Uncharacterized protein n=1 Tax=Comamonas endophytica TaxID=2949090 RepID=A0ABY6G6E4_9BURK|nr:MULTISPECIES: hypothetical protein [unclassified Acidovorax]MCD2512390.1 hypothetical protein [Acidovorax sp. D4N7]UYG50162.1 hypothetical protein M9799_08495 [Acidovorax sp. 5MLIR]